MLSALAGVLAFAPQDPALDAAKKALADGRAVEANHHALVALEHEPTSLAALELLLASAAGDGDARILWSHQLAAVACDAHGKLDLPRALLELTPAKDASIAAIAAARAAAADELADLVAASRKGLDKAPENVAIFEWARALGRDLVHAAPALSKQHELDFAAEPPPVEALRKPVLAALGRELESARASGRTGDALETALILRGLSAQARFEDLEGPKAPKLDDAERDAVAAIGDLRRDLAREAAPLTVEQLDLMDGAQRDAFTREHRHVANPGVATSPRGWYRVETTCGHATLLGAAQTIEQHHERLAKWYGRDPFSAAHGTLRIVPEASDLESEGAPFWWAGGFQSGDVTTMRFSCSSIEALGHGLTHELTHRFDGALYPGCPAWLMEGKAVWTGAAFANAADEEFVEDHALFGTIEDASIRGYGARDKLEQLIDGTIEDYRDNYVAGYALYVYLRTQRDENAPPRFAKRLEEFMASRKHDKRAPLVAFAAHFADGKESRPKDMAAFAEDFGRWAGGFYWRDRKPWTKRYVESAGKTEAELVLDEPIWGWARNRAEPWFGQDQARAAGELLLRAGDETNALRAFAWSLAVDERDDDVERALAKLFDESGAQSGAWIARAELGESTGPAPMLARLPKLRGWLDALREAAKGYAGQGHVAAAAVLAADHDAIAARVGGRAFVPELRVPEKRPELHPFDEPRASLMKRGWLEDRLTDYEKHRVAGAWCLDERGNLHVGRSQPRVGTGTSDREAYQHDAFARSSVWLTPGRYSVKARITPTTSYVSGAVVLGYGRRDRNVRLQFTAGDFLYAIGDKEEAAELDKLDWQLHGLRERDYGLAGATSSGKFAFPHVVSSFEVELAVDGAAVHASIDGQRVASYRTPDGAAIEGYLGFAVGFGDVKVSDASVQRLDRSAAWNLDPAFPCAFDVARARPADFKDLVGREIRGLPLSRAGTLCLWLQPTELDEGATFDGERALQRCVERVRDFEVAVARDDLAAKLVVALPKALGAELLPRTEQAIRAVVPELAPRLTFVAHGPPTAPELAAAKELHGLTDAHQSWLLFVDPAGTLRCVQTFHTGKALEVGPRRWLEVFRLR